MEQKEGDLRFQIFLLQRKNEHLKNKLRILESPFARGEDGKTYIKRSFESFHDWLFWFLEIFHRSDLNEKSKSVKELFHIRNQIQRFLDDELHCFIEKKRLESANPIKKELDQTSLNLKGYKVK